MDIICGYSGYGDNGDYDGISCCDGWMVDLLIDQYHSKYCNTAPRSLTVILRLRYWILFSTVILILKLEVLS